MPELSRVNNNNKNRRILFHLFFREIHYNVYEMNKNIDLKRRLWVNVRRKNYQYGKIFQKLTGLGLRFCLSISKLSFLFQSLVVYFKNISLLNDKENGCLGRARNFRSYYLFLESKQHSSSRSHNAIRMKGGGWKSFNRKPKL